MSEMPKIKHTRTINNLIIKNIFLPLGDIYLKTNVKKYYDFLNKTQYWSKNKLLDYQNKRLRYIINIAYRNVPFYNHYFKSNNIDPYDINNINDLQKLPIVNKKLIKKNYQYFYNINEKYKEYRTSGTTGEPFSYRTNYEALSVNQAIALRSWSWGGYRIGDKTLKIGGALVNQSQYNLNLRDLFMRYRVLPTNYINNNTISMCINFIKKFKPEYIHGFPSAIFIIAKYLLNNNVNITNIKGIMTSSEKLFDRHREIIKEAFKCDIIDVCGTSDGGEHFSECSMHSGYHIGLEDSIHEFIDENYSVVKEKTSRVVVTDLWNTSMPFIRYETGDMAIIKENSCSCGRNLPLISNVQGRVSDLVELNDGSYLPGLSLGDIFESEPLVQKVIDYQIIQETINLFTINIVLEDFLLEEKDIIAIQTFFNNYLNNKVIIDLRNLPKIDRTTAGKRKIFISRIVENNQM